MSLSAGIDVGSSTIKFVILDDGKIVNWEVVPSTSQPLSASKALLDNLGADVPVVATGYGRDMIEFERKIPTVSEIKAHASGARLLFPSCRSIIDIGGQDVKAIALDNNGRVSRFEMNDRCAAGTGKFLEVAAGKFNCSLEEFSSAALKGKDGIKISSLCTVFAESEIIGLINRGCSPEDISRALHWSVVNRIKPMFSRVDAAGPTAITGGGSKNAAILELFRQCLQTEILHSPYSQIAGAIGCAISAYRI
jgi:predicted CoA-substrate-specific enzyme activase